MNNVVIPITEKEAGSVGVNKPFLLHLGRLILASRFAAKPTYHKEQFRYILIDKGNAVACNETSIVVVPLVCDIQSPSFLMDPALLKTPKTIVDVCYDAETKRVTVRRTSHAINFDPPSHLAPFKYERVIGVAPPVFDGATPAKIACALLNQFLGNIIVYSSSGTNPVFCAASVGWDGAAKAFRDSSITEELIEYRGLIMPIR
jgi:hypothetical protein